MTANKNILPRKLLFIYREGTLVKQVPTNNAVNALEAFQFYPGVFTYLGKIASEGTYDLIWMSDQDTRGNSSDQENRVNISQHFINTAFENENIFFQQKPAADLSNIFRDKQQYDLPNSYVIAGNDEAARLAKVLGCKAILLQPDLKTADASSVLYFQGWDELYTFLKLPPRSVVHQRNTKETRIAIQLNLDGSGKAEIKTGLHFFDHMLEQLARHGGIDINLHCAGDLQIDEHHTIEDTGIALGEAFAIAMGNKRGMERYGFNLPMDDALAKLALDFGGRPWLVWKVKFKREKIGDVPTEMFEHFFKSFCDAARCNINIKCKGKNEHHKIEAIFKAFAKAIKMAVKRDINNQELPTTKGII